MLRREFLGSIALPLLAGVNYPSINYYTEDDYGCVEEVLVDPQNIDYIFSKKHCQTSKFHTAEDGISRETGYLKLEKNQLCTCCQYSDYNDYADLCWHLLLASSLENIFLHQENPNITKLQLNLNELNNCFWQNRLIDSNCVAQSVKGPQHKITDVFIDECSKFNFESSNGILVHKIQLNKYKDFLEDKLEYNFIYENSEIIVGIDLSNKYEDFIIPVHGNKFGCAVLSPKVVMAEIV